MADHTAPTPQRPTPASVEERLYKLQTALINVLAQRDRARGDLNISAQRTRSERARADRLAAENRRLRDHIAACPSCSADGATPC